MVIYVQERAATGATRRLSATESFAFFGQPQVRQQLATQFTVESVVPRIGFTGEQLADYLNNPPPGNHGKTTISCLASCLLMLIIVENEHRNDDVFC